MVCCSWGHWKGFDINLYTGDTMNNEEFLTLKITVSADGNSAATCQRLISRNLLDNPDQSKQIIDIESKLGMQYAAKILINNITKRSPLSMSSSGILKYLESEFRKAIPGFYTEFYMNNDSIRMGDINHDDWFIDGVGRNPKYEDISDDTGYDKLMYSYAYKGNGEWCQARAGSNYYESRSETVVTPFKMEDINLFIESMAKSGFKIALSNFFVNDESELQDKISDKEDV